MRAFKGFLSKTPFASRRFRHDNQPRIESLDVVAIWQMKKLSVREQKVGIPFEFIDKNVWFLKVKLIERITR
jgi:hypothetical protein